ncbi:MAG: FecR domain-containing protein [Deltaproteobacteria bacterium]|nr:FecR domain-containing protein [Deltaproteobacteria bacterium]
MFLKNKQCGRTLDSLANYKKLDAVTRSHIDLHLRSCKSCNFAAKEFARIEGACFPETELSKDRLNNIYDRLTPAVHEIVNNKKNIITKNRNVIFKQISFASAGIASAAAILFAVIYFNQPINYSIAGYEVPSSIESDISTAALMVNDGRIDKIQGSLKINNKSAADLNGIFKIESNTTFNTDSGSSSVFRIGNIADIAIEGETTLSVDKIDQNKIYLTLLNGKMAAQFDGSTGRKLEVTTPTAVVSVKGTIFTVEVFKDGVTQVSVTRGEVEVLSRNSDGVLDSPTSVTKGSLLQVPGIGKTVTIGDAQKVLAQNVEKTDLPIASAGRMVNFTGTQDHIKVEVDGRTLGYTPLTVRLPSGRLSYKLTKPGMAPYVAWLKNEQVSEDVTVAMNPEDDYLADVISNTKNLKSEKAWTLKNSGKNLDKNSKDYLSRASSAMKAGDLSFAANLLEKVSPKLKGGDLVTATSLLAECYSALGLYKEAASKLNTLSTLVPGTPIAMNAKYEEAKISMDHLGDYNRARNSFLSYIANPSGGQFQEDAYFSLCEIYGREGYRKNAISCFNEYLTSFPNGHRSAYGRLWRGVLYQETSQDWKKAEEDLISFINAKPQHPRCEEARYRIALGRYHTKNYGGAMRMIKEYEKEHPQGQYHIRIERLKQAITNSPE